MYIDDKELLEEAEAILEKNKDKNIQYVLRDGIIVIKTYYPKLGGDSYFCMTENGTMCLNPTRKCLIHIIADDLKRKRENKDIIYYDDIIKEENDYINEFTQKIFDETTKKKGERNMRNDLTTDHEDIYLNTTENILQYEDTFKNIEFKIYNVKKYVASRERIYFIDTKGRYYYINIDRYDTEIYDTSYNKLKKEIGDYVDLLE